MNLDRTTVLSLTLALLVLASAVPTGGLVETASADDHGEWYTVKQPEAGVCYEVQAFTVDHEKMQPEVEVRGSNDVGDVQGEYRNPDWDGPVTIESIMDYRYRDGDMGQTSYYAPYINTQYLYEPWDYGTYGLYNWSENGHSRMFFYENAAGDVSLVMRHDRLYDEVQIASHDPYNGNWPNGSDGFHEPSPGGGSVTFEFRDLPQGEWAYLDDMYPREDMDNTYYDADGNRYGHREAEYDALALREFDGGYFQTNWNWGENRTDGGAYRGLDNLEPGERLVIDNEFSNVDEWEVRSNEGDVDGTLNSLRMNQQLIIERGQTCLSGSITSSHEEYEVGSSVTLSASEGGSNYAWDLDGDDTADANTSSSEYTHTYNETGTVNPSVIISGSNGETVQAATEIVVRSEGDPAAALDVYEGEDENLSDYHVPGETMVFNASASEDNVRLSGEYEWEFGDGTNRTGGETVEYVYEEPGSYTVNVTVTDELGNNATAERTLLIDEPDAEAPEAVLDVSPTEFEEDRLVEFDASDSSDDRGIVAYEWDFDGDGEADDVTDEPTTTFAPSYHDDGTYNVSVVVRDDNGNEGNASVEVTVAPAQAPTVHDATANGEPPSEASITAGDEVELAVNATDADGEVTAYHWDLDDDGTFERETAEPTLTQQFEAGDYVVRVRATDAAGHNSSVRPLELGVDPGPVANLEVNASEVNAGDPVGFDADGSTAPSNVTEYRWDFDGDGVDDTTAEPTATHRYDSGGNYTATVTIVTERDNTHSDSAEIVVNEAEEKAISDGGGSSGGGGGGTSLGPPPVVTQVEERGPNEAVVDVQNARSDETVSASLPESEATAESGVQFERLEVSLDSDDAHVVFETAASADAPESAASELTADGTVAYLDLGAKYLDGGVEGATVEFAVEKSAMPELANGNDVALYHYDGEWERLDTEVVEETDDGYRLAATTDSLGTLAVGTTGSVSVTDASLAETTVAAGDVVEATATVENAGSEARTVAVNLAFGDAVVATETVEVPAGETADVTVSADAGDPGTYEVAIGDANVENLTVEAGATGPADVAVTDVELSESSIDAGEEVEITAVVENAGGEAGTYNATLTLFGEELRTKTVEVPGGETREVTFTQRVDAGGTYTVEVGGETAELEVTEEGGQSDDLPSPNVPGFGVGTALVALLAAALLARFRG